MIRRTFLTLAASAAALAFAGAASADTIKLGASAPKSGPLAGGAAMTHWPNIQLWVQEVNERGGLQVGDQQMQIEVIEYDDRTTNEEAVRNIQRLATQDQVDFIVTPYATGINVATAPMIAQHNYPHITTSAATDGVPEFVERWPNSFWLLGTSRQLAMGMVSALERLRDAGEIGNRVALVHVADAFGLELMSAGKPALEEAGFEIVYETSYPFGTQDVAPVISGAIAAEPDAFVAFSYPGDTFALTEQAQIQGMDVGAFYTGVGTAFPNYRDRFGDAVEGVLGIGGINVDDARVQDYIERHKEVTGQEPDYWASAYTYAGLQILGQAIEQAGTLDRQAVIDTIATGTFDTVLGEITLDNNANPNVWTTGQWVDGVFRAVSAEGLDIAGDPVRKQGWD
jgi:branched-chain amino acid transport system substrate-binding protein